MLTLTIQGATCNHGYRITKYRTYLSIRELWGDKINSDTGNTLYTCISTRIDNVQIDTAVPTHTHIHVHVHVLNYTIVLYTDNGLLLLTVNLADSVIVLLVSESMMLHVYVSPWSTWTSVNVKWLLTLRAPSSFVI